MQASIDYFHAIAQSLIRQGFKRIIWTSFHGPASIFIAPVVRDVFDTHKVSMLYIDPTTALPGGLFGAFKEWGGVDPFGDLALAAYDALGRLDDVPLTTAETEYWAEARPSSNAFAKDLMAQAFQSTSTAYFFAEHTDHLPTQALRTPEERTAAAARGKRSLDQVVGLIPIEKLVDDLVALREYNEAVIARYPSTRAL